MNIRVLLFAHLRDIAGAELSLDVQLGSSAEELCAKLAGIDERFGRSLASTRIAVNGEWADGATILHDGDELALIPPVSGG
ncbi:MAG TPA: MoaD/ThiS family protein [Capsulimonadaceae bacterium]